MRAKPDCGLGSVHQFGEAAADPNRGYAAADERLGADGLLGVRQAYQELLGAGKPKSLRKLLDTLRQADATA
jgi:hypothetical protein